MRTIDPIRIYDYLTLARRRILDAIRTLSAEQYGQEFPIGPGTLGKTLTHIMISEWYYIQRLLQRDVPPYDEWPIKQEHPSSFANFEAAWNEQADQTRTALNTVGDWTADIEYGVTLDDGRKQIVTTTAADLFAQLILHEVHHRAQVLNILRQLGVAFDEDLDFNAMMFKRHEARGG